MDSLIPIRPDPTRLAKDGKYYTECEFMAYYGIAAGRAAWERASTMNNEVQGVAYIVSHTIVSHTKDQQPMLATKCKIALDLTTLINAIGSAAATVDHNEQKGNTTRFCCQEEQVHTKATTPEQKEATLQWHTVSSHKVDIKCHDHTNDNRLTGELCYTVDIHKRHDHENDNRLTGELFYTVDVFMPINQIVNTVARELAIPSAQHFDPPEEVGPTMLKVEELIRARYHLQSQMAFFLHRYCTPFTYDIRAKNTTAGIALIDIGTQWQNFYERPLAPVIQYCRFDSIEDVIRNIQRAKNFPEFNRRFQHLPKNDTRLRARKLKKWAHRQREEAAEEDKTCFRQIHVNHCKLNGAIVHDAVKKHFSIHKAQSIIIHDAYDPTMVMCNKSDSTARPKLGLWVLVFKSGERQAELGNLYIINGNASGVELWENIGDLTNRSLLKTAVDGLLSLTNEYKRGFTLRLIKDYPCSAGQPQSSSTTSSFCCLDQ